MKKITIFLLSILFIAASSSAQIAISGNDEEKVSENELALDNKKWKETVVSLTITKKSKEQTRDYSFRSIGNGTVKVSLQSDNPQIAFSIYQKGQKISGENVTRNLTFIGEINSLYTINISFKGIKETKIMYKLKILQSH